MVCGTFTRKGVSQAQLQMVVNLFKANIPPPTSVTSTKENDGTYTVVATWPPCPPDTTHSAV